MSKVLSLINISKSFKQGGELITILDDISLSLKAGELVGLLGPSGSGKSSLLHIAGLLDTPSSGFVMLDGINNYSKATDIQRTFARNQYIGFIYQAHHLMADFTALENVIMPLLIKKIPKKQAINKAMQMLEQVGLADKIHRLPGEMSGGEQQRVAIIRSLINEPKLLLADEPTGNLDSDNCNKIFDIISAITRSSDIASLIVTHNTDLAKQMDICYTIQDKKVVRL